MIAAEGSRSLVYLPGQGAEVAARTELQEGFNYGDLRNDFVLSSSGERLARASWETVDIYQIPSLDHLRTIRLGSEARGRRIVFFDGEAIMLFAKYPCEPIPNAPYPNCRSSALLVLNPGADKFEPSASFLDLEAVAIDKAGASAAIVRSDSTAAVLSVPMGQVIAELPRQTGVRYIAISPRGDRVAIANSEEVAIFTIFAGSAAQVLREKRIITNGLIFSEDGRTLFAGGDVVAYREGAPQPETRPPPPLKIDLFPKGFEAISVADGYFNNGDGTIDQWEAQENVVAAFGLRNAELGSFEALVRITVEDPREFADPPGEKADAESWARRVFARIWSNGSRPLWMLRSGRLRSAQAAGLPRAGGRSRPAAHRIDAAAPGVTSGT